MNWDDLKIFLAVARRRKLNTAASDVKLDVTTVSRRIKRLEESTGHTLFERLRSGHELTIHGHSLLIQAELVEAQIDGMAAGRGELKHNPTGTLRISVAEGFGAQVLAPILGQFINSYPQIDIELVSGSGFLSLSKREADVAIGLSRSKSRHIESTLLSPYDLHLYASENYLKSHPKIQSLNDLHEHKLIDYIDDLIYSDELKYFEKFLPDHRPAIRSTSIVAQKTLVENGAGIAILPDFLVKGGMPQILPDQLEIRRQFWFSVHQSVAPLAKVKVFREFAFKEFSGLTMKQNT